MAPLTTLATEKRSVNDKNDNRYQSNFDYKNFQTTKLEFFNNSAISGLVQTTIENLKDQNLYATLFDKVFIAGMLCEKNHQLIEIHRPKQLAFKLGQWLDNVRSEQNKRAEDQTRELELYSSMIPIEYSIIEIYF